ncbi:MAG: DUF3825 domain-containing protein [Paratractidigestivibacter faecalis]|uniref:DUF3825 domain-containing protein n=1 Tax=Paratractidigestivibacter faecalis TaxID=2292441 RepID=UPI0026EB7A92|nr:DUF3825 domain-containing protein [Paratractidigestivibacter faecalis]MDD6417500.1 DUF3825 domain-containing protein [Paratractidigestivibacter faecalis]
MAKITAGNALYLYRLLGRELGVGKQTSMARAAEVLEADGIWPEDLGCVDVRALCEALTDFTKVTAFKKGQVLVTVMRNEELDRMLERAGKPTAAEKAASKGKPWKHRKGVKAVKPQKPRHVEKPATVEPVVEPAPDLAPEPVSEPVTEPVAEEEPQAEAAVEKTTEAEVTSEAATKVEVASEPAAEPEPEPAPAAPEPSIKLTIMFDPDPDPEPEPAPVSAAIPTPAPAPAPARPERAHADLPQDFYADVRCPDEQLSTLYQLLPADVDPMATLEEDFRLARSTHALEGTRSNVTFPLRYQRADGSPVTVTLRRTARAQAGKHWTLAEVTGDAPETVGLEGLSRRVEGAWRAFASDEDAAAATSPEDELARYAVLGSWDRLLADLAGAAEAENWGTDLHVLKDFLTMTFHRERLQGRLAVTDDGSSAAFDTGLLSPEGEPICAVLEPRDGDIAWELACFSTNACARAASYGEAPSVQTVIDALLAANSMDLRRLAQRLARNPRTMALAYDAVADEVRVLLPGKSDALVVDLADNTAQITGHVSLEDAYSCARVVSSDQPGWLAAGLG